MQIISENFNLTISPEINEILEADRINLNIKNKSTLINLIVSYYITYEIQENEEKIKKEIKKKLKILKSKEEIEDIFKILKDVMYPNLKNGKNYVKLNFRLNKDTFEKYENYLQEMEQSEFNISKFFREIFEWYSRKKQYEREIILYKDTVEKIKGQLLKNNFKKKILRIKIKTLGNKEVQVAPLGMVVSKNESHVYLLGYSEVVSDNKSFESTKKFGIFPTRISNIKEIKTGKIFEFIDGRTQEDLSKISYDILEEAKQMEKKRITSYGEEKDIRISLTKKGKEMLEMIIFNRPFRISEIEPEEDLKNERYIYTFKNTSYAVKSYFFNFGKECEILYPESLREDFKKFYLEAYIGMSNK